MEEIARAKPDIAAVWRPLAGRRNGAQGQQVFADIAFRRGAVTQFIDVVVGNPMSRTAIATHNTHIHADALNTVYEVRKRQWYAGVDDPAPLHPERLVPFALDMTGRLGLAAKTFVSEIFAERPDIRSRLIKRISMTLARWRGKVLCAGRAGTKPIPRHAPHDAAA
jgi:hypothetical protein